MFRNTRKTRRPRRRTLTFGLFLAPLVVAGGAWMSLGHFDREGRRFFETGRAVVGTLAGLAGAVEARDPAGIANFYSAQYQGSPLGITDLRRAGQRDGIAVLRFAAGGSPLDRDGALGRVAALPGRLRIDRGGGPPSPPPRGVVGRRARRRRPLRGDRHPAGGRAAGDRPRFLPHALRAHAGGAAHRARLAGRGRTADRRAGPLRRRGPRRRHRLREPLLPAVPD